MEPQKIIISDNIRQSLTQAIQEADYDRLFVLVDETTRRLCLPLVSEIEAVAQARIITIQPGDTNKSLDTLAHVWSELQQGGATRHSLMVNLGGGMVTDLGGFAASTFKRGIAYINIPTTLLSMVDASVGGKTGINFGGLKNEVGVFRNAQAVILDAVFLKTMDTENLLSGYAEMLKHGLINTVEMWAGLIGGKDAWMTEAGCPATASTPIPVRLIADSVAVKQRIVTEDPTEQGIRKALNLGHTAGHAFESLALQRTPILHGYAVAYGLIVELYLSCIKTGFPVDQMRQTVSFIREHYGRMAITCDDYPQLIQLMHHDKKNVAGTINFTLLGGIGDIRINQTASEDEIREALDFYQEC
ncbi:MAG: 3-dehydroquinate synthase [Prevotella sp.]|nr:3-dehydroquinate synthase [Prevotella sp.]